MKRIKCFLFGHQPINKVWAYASFFKLFPILVAGICKRCERHVWHHHVFSGGKRKVFIPEEQNENTFR